ncbi:MAG: ATP-binding protein [Desulfopila sp.]
MPYSREQIRQKRRLVRWTIAICLCLIPIFIYLQSSLYSHGDSLPSGSNILLFALINVNVLLVLFVLFLVLRSLAELLFERRIGRPGSRLKSKLIASFLSLTLIPTILLFFVALQFISTSMEYWFNANIENSLTESLKLAQSILHDTTARARRINGGIARKLAPYDIAGSSAEEVEELLTRVVAPTVMSRFDSITLIPDNSDLQISLVGPGSRVLPVPRLPIDVVSQTRTQCGPTSVTQDTDQGDLVRSLLAITMGENQRTTAIIATSILIPGEQLQRMELISRGLEGYRQLKHFKDPFKFWIFIILLLVLLLIFFAAIWFGLYISRGITDPLARLVAATQRVAEGDLEFEMESDANDEIGYLVNSFNQMTENLAFSNRQLAETHTALQQSSQQSEQRRRYTEIILQNVSAGVISLNEQNRIITINRFAEQLLNIDKSFFIGKTFVEVLPVHQQAIIFGFIDQLNLTGKTSVEQHLKLNVMGRNFSLLVHFTRLTDEDGTSLGHVLVFDNLTKLEKMQRMAAWREVAKRIAHEIKNPLTPIQLSAQRLRRRYPAILAEEDRVFDECTSTIIGQVDELKRLVSEFSQFARMPHIHKGPADLMALAHDTLVLYREAHKHITFDLRETSPVPIFQFDAEQIKRCLINLLDNAVAVLPDGGRIDIELSLDEPGLSVFIKVADDGPGISSQNKVKLFEPYFSTKKTGTGLGLAIVSTIVADHSGYIRVQDNQPRGSVFVIELPLGEWQAKTS